MEYASPSKIGEITASGKTALFKLGISSDTEKQGTHHASEWKWPQKELESFLVVPNLTEGYRAWLEPMPSYRRLLT